MKRHFQKGDSDIFDLAWLDDEELHKLQEAMLSYLENDICAYWLHCLNEQLAIRAGKLRIIPGAEVKPQLNQRVCNLFPKSPARRTDRLFL
jgi:hypothetical protein